MIISYLVLFSLFSHWKLSATVKQRTRKLRKIEKKVKHTAHIQEMMKTATDGISKIQDEKVKEFSHFAAFSH